MSASAKLPFKVFWEAVEQRLTACSAAELRAILQGLARETPPSERQDFLERLQAAPAVDDKLAQAALQEDLLADIDDLAQEMRNEMENFDEDRYGWQEYDDEDSVGPYEDFLDPLNGLFDRAEAVFDQGNPSLARAAYQKLFAILRLEDDYGRGIRASDLQDVDIDAAYARYLRAVYEGEPPAQRPQQLFTQLLEAHAWGSGRLPMLGDLLAVAVKPLPEQDAFLADWIEFLRGHEGFEADAWLREAVRLTGGVGGLAQLARAEGTQRPRVWLDWCAMLTAEGQWATALAAAQEALQALPAALPIRAAIADYLCQSAAALQQPELIQAGCWEALQAKPTLLRLLQLWDVAPPPQRDRQLQEAAAYLQHGLNHPPAYPEALWRRRSDDLEMPVRVNESTLAHAYLLAGDWAAAQRLSRDASVLGWSSSANPQGLTVAFFLALLSGKTPAALPANLRQLWVWNLQNSVGFSNWLAAPDAPISPMERLERIYSELFPRFTLDAPAQTQLLNWCLQVAQQRVESIVSRQHRDSYDRAAVLLGACAETLRLRGDEQEASRLLADVRNRFPRHRAFLKELSVASGKGMR